MTQQMGQAWGPEFNSWYPHDRKREQTSESYFLIFTCVHDSVNIQAGIPAYTITERKDGKND